MGMLMIQPAHVVKLISKGEIIDVSRGQHLSDYTLKLLSSIGMIASETLPIQNQASDPKVNP